MGQTLRTGRSLMASWGCARVHWHRGLPEGIQGTGRRQMQASVSCSGGRRTTRDPHAMGGDQRGEHRGPDLKHSRAQQRRLGGQTKRWEDDINNDLDKKTTERDQAARTTILRMSSLV